MKHNFEQLLIHYYKIKNMGWIKSKRRGTGGIGYTFETLIGKEEENFPIPDYNQIEIKTKHKCSIANINLFNITPDGDYLFPIKRVLEKLGYPDRQNPEYRVFNIEVNAKEYTKIGYYKKIRLYVNKEEQKIELIAMNANNKRIDVDVSWSFKMLKDRLNLKMKYLSIVKADSKILGGVEYFNYNEIDFYKLKDFDSFIYMIEKGKIVIKFKIGVFRTGVRKGQMHDRGTSFSLNYNYINDLYEKIYL